MDKEPLIPAHAGIQSRKNKPHLGARFRGDERR
jgi:hypothetical protein